MRTKAIKALTEKTGDERTSGVIWDLLVSKCFAGCEPSETMFKMLPKEKALDATPVGFHGPLAALWPEAPEAPKGRKFKAGRSYTAAEYAGFYEQFPENVSLCEDIERATDGKPWVVFTTKFHAAQSAKYIGWHMGEDIAPATIDVDGVPVAPVMPGEERRKEAKEYPVDPHTPGGFLDVEGKSPRTHADFTGYSEEEIQATIMAYPKLARMDDLSLQNLTLANRGKGAAAILRPFPEIAAAWAAMKPKDRPCTKAPKRPFAEPPAPTMAPRGGDVARPEGWVPTLCFLGARANKDLWRKFKAHLSAAQEAGLFSMVSDDDVPPGGEVEKRIAGYVSGSDAVFHLATTESIAREKRAITLAFDGPKVPVILGHLAALDLIFPGLRPIPADGKPIEGDKGMAAAAREITEFARRLRPRRPTSSRPTWTSETLRTVHAAMVSARLDRSTLLAGIPTDLASSLPRADNPSAQIMRDMMMLKDVRMSDGSTPLREYIANAAHHCRGQRQEVVFREAMAALDA